MAYEDLIKRLRCPADRAELEHFDQVVLVCTQCSRAYPIRDGIPIMLLDDEVQAEGAKLAEEARAKKPAKPAVKETSDDEAEEGDDD